MTTEFLEWSLQQIKTHTYPWTFGSRVWFCQINEKSGTLFKIKHHPLQTTLIKTSKDTQREMHLMSVNTICNTNNLCCYDKILTFRACIAMIADCWLANTAKAKGCQDTKTTSYKRFASIHKPRSPKKLKL